MKNAIIYYYNLNPSDVHQKNDIYYFKINNSKFFLYPLTRNTDELDSIFQINLELIKNGVFVHKIILNKDKNIVTNINNKPYILFNSAVKKNDLINMYDILELNKKTILLKDNTILNKSNWINLWERKNDYLEYQVSQFGIKYPVICECFSYYIGLAENAIIYAKNTLTELKPGINDKLVISHRRINEKTTLFDLYNPLEFIIDYNIRDIAEYIKFKFFYNKDSLWEEINDFYNSNQVSQFASRLLYARLLYPTYFFDLYDEILDSETENEESLVKILDKQEEYEEFLDDFYHFVSTKYYIPPIDWLIKR